MKKRDKYQLDAKMKTKFLRRSDRPPIVLSNLFGQRAVDFMITPCERREISFFNAGHSIPRLWFNLLLICSRCIIASRSCAICNRTFCERHNRNNFWFSWRWVQAVFDRFFATFVAYFRLVQTLDCYLSKG